MAKAINRRTFIQSVAGAALASALWPKSVLGDDNTLRIGYLPITDAAPLLVAHGLGYFREEGLRVEDPVRVRSWSTLSESFLTGKFNLTHLLLPIPVWMRYNNGADVKVLAWNHTNGSALTVGENTQIRDFSDLGGKIIAVPYWYSMHNVLLQMGIQKAGLLPVIQPRGFKLHSNEVNLLVLPPSEMPVALSSGKIDGYIVAEPFNAVGEVRTGAKILRFTGDMWRNHPCCVAVMKDEEIRKNPVFVQKVVNALVRAQHFIGKNRLEAAKMLSKEEKKYLPVSGDILIRAFSKYDTKTYANQKDGPVAIQHPEWKVERIGFQPYPYPSATRFILEQLQNTKVEGNNDFLKKNDLDFMVRDLVNDTFVKKAVLELGGPEQFELMRVDGKVQKTPWERKEMIDI